MAVGDDYMLTTEDNPFNPFTEWDEWYAWDAAAGRRHTRLSCSSCENIYDLSEGDQALAIDDAVDEILKENVIGLYKKVYSSG